MIRETLDEAGAIIVEREDLRFRKARAGDMLMVPFQCELCHFRNVYKRDPWPTDTRDTEVLEFMRRAILDSLWARETSTVKGNLRDMIRAETNNQSLGLPSILGTIGPFPLKDDFGMQAAIAVLIRSLDKGVYEKFVQWDTFRKTRSAITNGHQASAKGMKDVIGAYERNRMWISKVPTHSLWYIRFSEGLHRRVGEVVRPDWPIPVAVVKAIDDKLNEIWGQLETFEERKKVAEMGVWFVVGFCTGLRGEEMLQIEFMGTYRSLRFLRDPTLPHFEVRIVGRTKGHRTGGNRFGIPVVAVTERTKLEPGRWIRRLTQLLRADGKKDGLLFERNLRSPRLHEFEEDWYEVLENIQHTTKLIDAKVDIREDAGILRTLRRGVSSHARVVGVDRELIEAVNRWRKEAKSDAGRKHLPMIDQYTELDTLKPLYLEYSRPL